MCDFLIINLFVWSFSFCFIIYFSSFSLLAFFPFRVNFMQINLTLLAFLSFVDDKSKKFYFFALPLIFILRSISHPSLNNSIKYFFFFLFLILCLSDKAQRTGGFAFTRFEFKNLKEFFSLLLGFCG